MIRRLTLAAAAATAALTIAGCSPQLEPTASAEVYTAAAADARALPLIDPAQQIPAYDREALFGEPWTVDLDGNGCNARQDVLTRDLRDVVTGDNGCTVLSGVLDDPYTGERIEFFHNAVAPAGNAGSIAVQVDHVVSLYAAHRGGAWQWSQDARLRFANDTAQLLAVDGDTNEDDKREYGPGRWLPSNPAYVCTYARYYTHITTEWQLAVDEADRDALATVLDDCAAAAN